MLCALIFMFVMIVLTFSFVVVCNFVVFYWWFVIELSFCLFCAWFLSFDVALYALFLDFDVMCNLGTLNCAFYVLIVWYLYSFDVMFSLLWLFWFGTLFALIYFVYRYCVDWLVQFLIYFVVYFVLLNVVLFCLLSFSVWVVFVLTFGVMVCLFVYFGCLGMRWCVWFLLELCVVLELAFLGVLVEYYLVFEIGVCFD